MVNVMKVGIGGSGSVETRIPPGRMRGGRVMRPPTLLSPLVPDPVENLLPTLSGREARWYGIGLPAPAPAEKRSAS